MATSAAEAVLVVALTKNGKEALIKSLATAITDATKSTLVAFGHGGRTINLAFVLDEFLRNKLMAIIATEAFSVTNKAHHHHSVAKDRFAANSAGTLRVLLTIATLTSKATISKLAEGGKRSLAARADKALLMVHLLLKAHVGANDRLTTTTANPSTVIPRCLRLGSRSASLGNKLIKTRDKLIKVIGFLLLPSLFFFLGAPLLFLSGTPLLFLSGTPLLFLLGASLLFFLGTPLLFGILLWCGRRTKRNLLEGLLHVAIGIALNSHTRRSSSNLHGLCSRLWLCSRLRLSSRSKLIQAGNKVIKIHISLLTLLLNR